MKRYVEAAVDSEIQTLRRTSSGRACATFRAAAAIGGFVGAGEVDKTAVERTLLHAALETGLPEREAVCHIRRGILRGEKTPLNVPPTMFHRNIKSAVPYPAKPTVPARTEAEKQYFRRRPEVLDLTRADTLSFPYVSSFVLSQGI